ncbi:MAG: pyridoxal phosphate-dependent aminotransferase [Burkholderiales bacterium]
MGEFDVRNRHFDRLFSRSDLIWMGQNTNHIPMHPVVREALHRAVDDESFHAYAPPAGMEALREGIVADLGLKGFSALVSDGAVAGLATVCRALCRPGRRFVTTDPSWKWPLGFARQAGMEVVEIPIYGAEHGWRLSAARLAQAVDDRTDIIYLVDPNNPLGTCATPEEIAGIVEVARRAGATLIHDCTYRDFAERHTLAATLYPEGTVTVTSFSKWLGLAGLRLGAIVAAPELIEKIGAASMAPLGANVISQKAALAGLSVKGEWMAQVQEIQRANQATVKRACEKVPGLSVPVYPSQANFLIVECEATGLKPEAIVTALAAHGIQVRQGAYHTQRFGGRFIKVSVTVPREWADAFAAVLPEAVLEAKDMKDLPPLF